LARGDKKGLTPADTDLWDKVSATIRPMPVSKTKRVSGPRRLSKDLLAHSTGQGSAPVLRAAGDMPGKPSPVLRPAPSSSYDLLTASDHPLQAASPRMRHVKLAPLDPKEIRRVRRGHIEIDATLDLHGMTLAKAYSRLCQFTSEAQRRQHRWLLVVTGKGAAGRGVIRENFPLWLAEAPLNQMVVGYHAAQPAHGGGGAFYVRLRRSS